MIQIDETDRNQDSGKNEKNQKIERQTEFHKQQQGQEGGNQLNQRVSPGNLSAAIPAPGAQNKKANHRNIIIKPNRLMTVRTLGKRLDDGFVSRYAKNTDIEKATDGGAENEGKNI